MSETFVLSNSMRNFFEVEIRNEEKGGVSPATLSSALDSIRQAPPDVLESWMRTPHEASFKAFDGELASLLRNYGPHATLRGLLSMESKAPKPTSILRTWVMRLPLRAQGTLLSAMRGCDAWTKASVGKDLVREIRGICLNPFDERECATLEGYIVLYPHPRADEDHKQFCRMWDDLPMHYVMHLMQAIEVIGYYHPDKAIAEVYEKRYDRMCHKMHLHPESRMQFIGRIMEDRIANNTVAS